MTSCKWKSSVTDEIVVATPVIDIQQVNSVTLNPIANTSTEAYNKAFLITKETSKQYYKTALNNTEKDYLLVILF